MKRLARIILIFIFSALIGFAESQPQIRYIPEKQDQTLTLEQYYALGMPKAVARPDDIKVVNRKLLAILKENPEQLPRYNSKKSGPLFAMIASFRGIDAILSSLKTDDDKQRLLMNYVSLGFQPARVYASCNRPQEYLLASSTALYANLLFLQLSEKHIAQSGRSLEQSGFDENKRKLLAKSIGYQYDLLDLFSQKESDPYVRETIKQQLVLLKKMIQRSKLIDQGTFFR